MADRPEAAGGPAASWTRGVQVRPEGRGCAPRRLPRRSLLGADRWVIAPSMPGPVFLDTSALYPLLDAHAEAHERVGGSGGSCSSRIAAWLPRTTRFSRSWLLPSAGSACPLWCSSGTPSCRGLTLPGSTHSLAARGALGAALSQRRETMPVGPPRWSGRSPVRPARDVRRCRAGSGRRGRPEAHGGRSRHSASESPCS